MFNFSRRRQNIDTRAIEWLVLLQSNKLTDKQKEDFFSWLETDVSHQTAYIRAERLWQQSEVLMSSRNEIIGKKSLLDSLTFDLTPRFIAGVSCVCAIFIVLAVLLMANPEQHVLEYRTLVGEQETITLPDGSHLTLNTDSLARIKFNDVRRTIFLVRGEALFDVTRDESRPFDVVTRSGVVRVKGTVFNVFDNGERTLVTVVEGRVGLEHMPESKERLVSVDTALTKAFHADITLHANEQMSLELAHTGTQPKKVSAKSQVSWKNKKLIYREETLTSVLKDVNRYYEAEIAIGDKSIANRKVVGIIAISDFNETLSTLEEVLQLKAVIEQQGNRAVLYSK